MTKQAVFTSLLVFIAVVVHGQAAKPVSGTATSSVPQVSGGPSQQAAKATNRFSLDCGADESTFSNLRSVELGARGNQTLAEMQSNFKDRWLDALRIAVKANPGIQPMNVLVCSRPITLTDQTKIEEVLVYVERNLPKAMSDGYVAALTKSRADALHNYLNGVCGCPDGLRLLSEELDSLGSVPAAQQDRVYTHITSSAIAMQRWYQKLHSDGDLFRYGFGVIYVGKLGEVRIERNRGFGGSSSVSFRARDTITAGCEAFDWTLGTTEPLHLWNQQFDITFSSDRRTLFLKNGKDGWVVNRGDRCLPQEAVPFTVVSRNADPAAFMTVPDQFTGSMWIR